MYYYKSATADTVPMLLLLLFGLTVLLQFQGKAVVALPGSSCQRWCGDVKIIYPFGIGARCAMKGFELDCNKTTNVTFFGTMPLLNISLLQGEIHVTHRVSFTCYNQSSRTSYLNGGLTLDNRPFTFSEQRNKFTVIGFNTFAYMIGTTNVIGCLAQARPYNSLTAQDGVCDGVGCCQVALTGNMSDYDVDFVRRYNTTNMSTTDGTEYCGYAVMMEARAFHFRTTYLNTTEFLKENDGRVPVILNWAVGNETCDIAKTNATSYACVSNNSTCIDSVNGQGYLCNCTEGYTGNPYLPDGCQDIDECAVNVPPPCPGHCKNTNGSFICPDQKPPSSLRYGTVVQASGVVIVVIAITCTYLILERKKLSNIKQKYFQQHGGMMLLQEISLKQGTGFSIFTEAELIEATDKFDDKNILGRGGHGTVYKGLLKDGSLIAVKRCVSMTSEQQKEEFGKEMLILSQINHKNIVKLLGCCLEVEVPMLVYEFIPNGTLFQFIHGDNGSRNIPFSTRIRIALESALALSYLHSWASPPILHGDVKSSNILLAENYEAKLSRLWGLDTSTSDKSQFMTAVQGTCGYLDPEYMRDLPLTDKERRVQLGVVLLELLTGSMAFNLEGPENERSLSLRFLNAMKEDKLVDIIDSRIKADGSDNGLLEEVAELARQCLDMIGERRPAMRDVAEKLDRLAKVMQHPWVPAQHNPEEMESLLGESSVASLEMISTGNFSMEKRIVQGLLDSGR
ncbi:unnamed protein product [Miscanthus lutarioriparius]|uniref:Protein kinase domain-containing protein n=1 Tax=Miscanthus lutarioriparius TaxID=422564 RepID=A0A811SGZ3_9POAL|nr:unnamed protein product [Miscanthus lutarioriparius]